MLLAEEEGQLSFNDRANRAAKEKTEKFMEQVRGCLWKRVLLRTLIFFIVRGRLIVFGARGHLAGA